MDLARAPGSFRDPYSNVFASGRRIFRGLRGIAADGYRVLERSGLLAACVSRGELVACRELQRAEAPALFRSFDIVLEHKAIECVTYPYEWPFLALKAAAVLHLDIQIKALDAGISLRDASAYNVQFAGPRPLFVDMGSFKPYESGELWLGHDQFARQFLNPLLLTSVTGVPFQPWLRGTPEGIGVSDLARLLPWYSKLSPRILMHVMLPAGAQRDATVKRLEQAAQQLHSRPLTTPGYRAILLQLREWIDRLAPLRRSSVWADYTQSTSYSEESKRQKRAFVAEFIGATTPSRLLDLGCNTGEYSALALASGAGTVIGLESDFSTLDTAFRRAQDEKIAFLPLYQDIADGSPDLGWRLAERASLRSRLRADAVLALAVVHHLAIGRNLPLNEVVNEIISFAPCGVIEFVDKDDPMVRRLLALREDIFSEYTTGDFRGAITRVARIRRELPLDGGSRMLFWFERERERE